MNNLVNINQSDPIFEEFEAFVDKNAGIKTIAFKYFGADVEKATEYLALEMNEDAPSSSKSSHTCYAASRVLPTRIIALAEKNALSLFF